MKDYVVKIANARNNISKHTYTNLTTLGTQLCLILSNYLTMDDDGENLLESDRVLVEQRVGRTGQTKHDNEKVLEYHQDTTLSSMF